MKELQKKVVTAGVFCEVPDTIGVSQDILGKFTLNRVSVDSLGKKSLISTSPFGYTGGIHCSINLDLSGIPNSTSFTLSFIHSFITV